MATIEFQNKAFKIREVFLPEFGNVVISTASLNELLLSKDGSYISDEAIVVDEKIFYFVEENEIDFPERRLINLLIEQVVC